MFEKIKSLFKKKNYFVDIKFDSEKYIKDKNVVCYSDFYTITGILDIIKQQNVENNLGQYHYKNIQANKKTCEAIYNLLKYNLKNTKNKFKRMYKDEYLDKQIAMDNLMWAPFINDRVEDNVIKVLLPNHSEFMKVEERK